jgi:hypothetical protein
MGTIVRSSWVRPALASVVAAVLHAFPAASLAAQGARGTVAGVVRDSAGAPVAGASVQVDSGAAWQPVGADGAFRVADVPVGERAVRARAVGFAEGAVRVRVDSGAVARVDVVLRRVTPTLDTVRTVAAPARRYGPAEFEARRQAGRGVFVTRAEFERRSPTRMSELLMGIPGIERRPYETAWGSTEYVLVFRGTSTVKGQVCPPSVYLDGQRFDVGKDDIDRLLRPSDIDAVEVYRSGGHVPPRFAGPTARCGVIVLWSRATSVGAR